MPSHAFDILCARRGLMGSMGWQADPGVGLDRPPAPAESVTGFPSMDLAFTQTRVFRGAAKIPEFAPYVGMCY